MYSNLKRRLAEEAGAGQVGFVGTVLILCVVAVAAFAVWTGKPASASPMARDVAAQRMALTASEAAGEVAGDHHGSYAQVGLLSLHKVSRLPIHRSAAGPWLSAASGRVRGYSVTVSAAWGDTYTITRDSGGSLFGTCHVTSGQAAGSVCQHVDASGNGVW